MDRLLGRVSPVLRLTRVTTAFAAVSNVWFVILWSLAVPDEHRTGPLTTLPAWLLLAAGAANALGLYCFGACFNDLLDVRRDRALRPERPLASGQLGVASAAVLVACTLLVAVLGASAFGTGAVLLTLALAALVLLFNIAGRFVPGVGLVLLALIYAGHMLTPNPGLRFLWPVWLVMTHAVLVAGATHVLARKNPIVSLRAWLFTALGWAGWSIGLFVLAWSRSGRPPPGAPPGAPGTAGELWPEWIPATAGIGPAILAVVFIALAIQKARHAGLGPRSADKIYRYGSLWLAAYNAAWAFGAGLVREGLILSAVAGVGLVAMTTLRELYGLAEQPVGYRR